ncbi:hypothetical protein [Tautonia plasticadhaerens]|uniref:Uncharacterized protein n=1 Tax=Tautonia plasticadhaerens TaxID=2527974 RepID=A0A518H254_9BACT|nr:hypothetical protein [Tautonia plasticadhaerens]QDV34907.1 hypothetical protein ElP_28040 [Tautonia plasticadhaerens]
MEISVKIDGLERLAAKSQPSKEKTPQRHNGRVIAALMDIGLAEMKRKGLVREHGD